MLARMARPCGSGLFPGVRGVARSLARGSSEDASVLAVLVEALWTHPLWEARVDLAVEVAFGGREERVEAAVLHAGFGFGAALSLELLGSLLGLFEGSLLGERRLGPWRPVDLDGRPRHTARSP